MRHARLHGVENADRHSNQRCHRQRRRSPQRRQRGQSPRTNGAGSDHIGPNGTFTADTNGTNGLNGAPPTAKMRPHILKFLPPSSTLYHTESFGPVLCLMTYADGDEADALRLANDTEYGLSSSVFCGKSDLPPSHPHCRSRPHHPDADR